MSILKKPILKTENMSVNRAFNDTFDNMLELEKLASKSSDSSSSSNSFFLLYDAWISTKQNYWYYPSSFGLNNYTWTATANSSDFKTSLSQESGYIYIPTACKLKSFGLNGVYPSADIPIEIGVKSGSLITDGTYFLGNLYSGTQTFKTNKYNTVRVNPDLLLPKDSVLAVGVRRISSSGTPVFLKAIMFFELEVING